jgi:proline dehydrogenase
MEQAMFVDFSDTEVAFGHKKNIELTRIYWLFKLINNNFLVKTGPAVLKLAIKLHLPVYGLVKSTIFNHFCGGQSIEDCEKTIVTLARSGIGTIRDFSVEGKHTEDDFEHAFAEIKETIEKGKNDPRIPYSVFKPSGISRIELLEKVQSGGELTKDEISEFEKVKTRIYDLCKAACEAGLPILIDAEESWTQDVVDKLAEEMMERFNKKEAIVFNTLQFYRHDRLKYLQDMLKKSEQKGYHVGIKLVRGAYMEKERERAELMGYPSPIQPDKAHADNDYDAALRLCILNIDRVSICSGTHNENSCYFLMELMKEYSIDPADKRVYFSQLLGMSDHISYNLAHAGYNVVKYVPYGPVPTVLPYLIRRAEENTAISGQMGRELKLILKEKERRKIKK